MSSKPELQLHKFWHILWPHLQLLKHFHICLFCTQLEQNFSCIIRVKNQCWLENVIGLYSRLDDNQWKSTSINIQPKLEVSYLIKWLPSQLFFKLGVRYWSLLQNISRQQILLWYRFFQILWKSRCHIMVTFPSHLKKIRSLRLLYYIRHFYTSNIIDREYK